jgi:ubiquinone/menaquinone biosynthesis C-methylase UbiE
MPHQTPAQVIETQRQDWNRVASGWEKWDHIFDENMTYLNHRLVADARLRSGLRVLDLGSGTGYPSLLAAQVVGPAGRVTGIDLADRMLAAAERKAKKLGLANVEFKPGDVTHLPFAGGCFDACISRFCLMFLPELPKALGEISRVLKSGGYLAAAVWSAPAGNPYLQIPIDTIKQFIELPPPDPEAPGIFRLAKPGDLAAFARDAGFRLVSEEEFTAEMRFSSSRDYYDSVLEIAAPIQNLFAKLSAEQRQQAERGIMTAAEKYQQGGIVALPIAVRFVTARKPL